MGIFIVGRLGENHQELLATNHHFKGVTNPQKHLLYCHIRGQCFSPATLPAKSDNIFRSLDYNCIFSRALFDVPLASFQIPEEYMSNCPRICRLKLWGHKQPFQKLLLGCVEETETADISTHSIVTFKKWMVALPAILLAFIEFFFGWCCFYCKTDGSVPSMDMSRLQKGQLMFSHPHCRVELFGAFNTFTVMAPVLTSLLAHSVFNSAWPDLCVWHQKPSLYLFYSMPYKHIHWLVNDVDRARMEQILPKQTWCNLIPDGTPNNRNGLCTTPD